MVVVVVLVVVVVSSGPLTMNGAGVGGGHVTPTDALAALFSVSGSGVSARDRGVLVGDRAARGGRTRRDRDREAGIGVEGADVATQRLRAALAGLDRAARCFVGHLVGDLVMTSSSMTSSVTSSSGASGSSFATSGTVHVRPPPAAPSVEHHAIGIVGTVVGHRELERDRQRPARRCAGFPAFVSDRSVETPVFDHVDRRRGDRVLLDARGREVEGRAVLALEVRLRPARRSPGRTVLVGAASCRLDETSSRCRTGATASWLPPSSRVSSCS